MFVTYEPLELINELINTGEANLKHWPLVYLKFPTPFCIGVWGGDNQVSLFTKYQPVLRRAITESIETPLISLTLFEPEELPGAGWTMHKIVKVWIWYGLDQEEEGLIFEEETGQKNDPRPKEDSWNDQLIWTSLAGRHDNTRTVL